MSATTFHWAAHFPRVLNTTATAWGFLARSHWHTSAAALPGHLAVSY